LIISLGIAYTNHSRYIYLSGGRIWGRCFIKVGLESYGFYYNEKIKYISRI
jgi:hypothetical protein